MKTTTEADDIEHRTGLSLKPETKAALNAGAKRRKPVPATQQPRDEKTGLPVRRESLIEALQRIASDKSIDVAKMRDIYVMHREEVTAAARVAYNKAMASCQQELPRVFRDAKNDATSSKFARLETIDRLAKPIYTKHGFSLSFGTDESKLQNHYGVTCDVMHDVGHVEHKRADVPADALGMKGNPNKTATHAFGSTMSYARRYLTLLVFNIVLTNEDDDGQGAYSSETINAEQYTKLKDLMAEASLPIDRFCKKFKIPVPAKLPASKYDEAVSAIEAFKAQKTATASS